ncbi:MAG: gamma-glutamyl-gamma-aminobutyrate hydrolase family protein [Rhodospirillales bacterium]|nr:gamma-glutamyl-gamma-aminobutyrate hydrolase family protein [Rhodospirillales bacterium]
MSRTRQPVIGITMDANAPGGYSAFPWLALRENYGAAVTRAGGLALLLPHEVEHAEAYADLVDGLIVSGGDFDVDPALFGAATRHPTVRTKDRRTAFEVAVTRAMLAADKPVLGICGGQQLLHVVLGGTLIQHIPDMIPGALAHEQENPRDEPGHTVRIVDSTRLRAIVGAGELAVNSAHHQAAADVPDGVVVNAIAPDGVIEGIEVPGYRFCIGVQWHPEYHVNDGDGRLFAAFVEAAAKAR